MIPQDTSKLLIEQNCAVSTQSTPMTRKNSGPSPCEIKNKDFSASFDGEKWTVVWNWTTGPPILKNKVGCYETRLKDEEKSERSNFVLRRECLPH